MSEEEPKIFIDEGWKAQVQREKEEAARKAAENQPSDNEEPADSAPEDLADADLEAASFTALVGSLATQIMFSLGLVAEPGSNRVMINLDAARYTLDILEVLRVKTEGNLTPEESEALVQSRDELEHAFAIRVQQFQEQALRQSGVDPADLRGTPGA